MPEQPIEPDEYALMNALGKFLDGELQGLGFALLVFEFGDSGRIHYLSNADQATMITAMKEFISVNEFGKQRGGRA